VAEDRVQEVQTDKADRKLVPCTYPDCNVDIWVNAFYAPAKARCETNHHKGKSTPSIRAAAAVTAVTTEAGTKDVVPNGALALLLCPICHSEMTLDQIMGNAGEMTFVCSKPGRCGTVVNVKLSWAWCVVKAVPEKWKPFVDAYNTIVRAKAKEIEELRKEIVSG
jgi:hypothetical protein